MTRRENFIKHLEARLPKMTKGTPHVYTTRHIRAVEKMTDEEFERHENAMKEIVLRHAATGDTVATTRDLRLLVDSVA